MEGHPAPGAAVVALSVPLCGVSAAAMAPAAGDTLAIRAGLARS